MLSTSVRDLPEWLVFDLYCNLEYAKTFVEFENLPLEDKVGQLKMEVVQVRLVQYSVLPLTVATQCYYSYKKGFTTVVHPDGVSPLAFHVNVLRFLPSFPRASRGTVNRGMYNAFIRVVEPLFRDQIDINEYLLLKAILLFDSSSFFPSQNTSSCARHVAGVCKFHRQNPLPVHGAALRLSPRKGLPQFPIEEWQVGTEKAPARFGSLLAQFQLYVTTANQHRSHMMAMEVIHREPDDVLIMQTIFRERVL